MIQDSNFHICKGMFALIEELKLVSFVRQLMVLETISTPLRIALVPSCPDRFLVAGCEQGCFAWDIRLDDKPQKNR